MAKADPVLKGRLFAVGDIHGCARELELLIRSMKLEKQDRVVFLGDYVDRGPDSRTVIDIILDLKKVCEVITLKGNHEALFLDFLTQPESAGAGLFILNGGSSTLANYMSPEGSIEIPEAHVEFFSNLQLTHETERYYFVHAGVPNQSLETLVPEEHEPELLWSRYPFLSSTYKWEKVIVHGHTPVNAVEVRPNRINIDTGCVYDGQLTAIELGSGQLYQVNKLKTLLESPYPREPRSHRMAIRFSGRIPVRAGRPGESFQNFQTLNYNQFGLLMEPLDSTNMIFAVEDRIEGEIGSDPNSLVLFSGRVVRVETRGARSVYGVILERISGGLGGPEWIERPES